jgi:hypothetical protein
MVGLSQLVFGLLPVRAYSPESFASFSTYQSLLIGISILVSAPTYSLLLASRFNSDNNEESFRTIRNWLASTFLLLIASMAVFALASGNLELLIIPLMLGLAFLSNFESAVLRSRLSFNEQWVHVSLIFFAESALRLILASVHVVVGTPRPVILISENICLQLLTVIIANRFLGRDGWSLVSPFSTVVFRRYYLLLLVTLSSLVLNTFIAPLTQLVNLESPREISLAIYLLMFSRIPSTILFPIIQPEIQRLILNRVYKLSVSKLFVIPLISIALYAVSILVVIGKFFDTSKFFGDTSFWLVGILSFSLAGLFILETSIAFYLVNSDRVTSLVKLYSCTILFLLLFVSRVTSALDLVSLVIFSEIIFLIVFVIGLQFRDKSSW